jgi:hypothetical protein
VKGFVKEYFERIDYLTKTILALMKRLVTSSRGRSRIFIRGREQIG